MIPTEKAHLLVAAATDPGMKGKNNEDQFAVSAFKVSEKDPTPSVFAMVADGIGGHRSGEVASDIAVEMISDAVASSDASQPVEIMEAAILQASQAILVQGNQNSENLGMGTTCVCTWVIGNQVFATHVGNSRLYLQRSGQLHQLNVDHTFVQEAIDAGALTIEQARSHPHANIIRRYLGSANNPEVDARIRTDRKSNFSPENQGFRMRPGDRLLLCSDGLNDMVPHEKISTTLRQPDIHQSVSELITAANQNGGKDNITVIILEMPKNGGVKEMWGNLREIQPQTAVSYAGLVVMVLAVLVALIMVLFELFS
ncbi:MAG TPA: protein phosphatase 2C domain-containing protein [Anaerolineales bacterium]|jgi:protein phosphatase|nr:protein phosphatase 2C domain-containing protein [Anaerolineales bacterium]